MANTYVELAQREIARLNSEIEFLEEAIHRHIETRSAWDTIVRNAGDEPHIVRASDQEPLSEPFSYPVETPVEARAEVHAEEPVHESWQQEAEPVAASDAGWKRETVSKLNALPDMLLEACDRSFNPGDLWKRLSASAGKREPMQGLGLS